MDLVYSGGQVYLDVGIIEDKPGRRIAHLKSLAIRDNPEGAHAAFCYGLVLLGELQLMAPGTPTSPVRWAKFLEYFAKIGLEDVTQEARTYIGRAAYLDFTPALTRLGKAFEFSEMGLEADKLSVQYYSLASARGDPLADMALSRWFTRGIDGLFEPNAYMVYAFAAKAAHGGAIAGHRLVDVSRGLEITSRDVHYLGVPWYGEAADALSRFHEENASFTSVDKDLHFAQTPDDIAAVKEARNLLEQLCKPCVRKTRSTTPRSLGTIEIVPFKLRNLQPEPQETSHAAHLTFSVGDQTQRTARARKIGRTPEWDEIRLSFLESDKDVIKRVVYGEQAEGNTSQILKMTCELNDGDSGETLVGVADVPLQTLLTNKEHDDWFRLEDGRRSCEVYVELTFWSNGEHLANGLEWPGANGHTVGSVEATYVRAAQDFDPLVPGELGFKKGEVIQVMDRAYDDFWRGGLRGKYGFFPAEYVVVLPRPTATRARALHSFDGQDRGELGFKEGDFIEIVHTALDDWWVGEMGNKQGRFPPYYVEVIEKPAPPEPTPRLTNGLHLPTVREPELAPASNHHESNRSAADSQAPVPPPQPPPRVIRPVPELPRLVTPYHYPVARPVRAINVHQWSLTRYPPPGWGFRSQFLGSHSESVQSMGSHSRSGTIIRSY